MAIAVGSLIIASDFESIKTRVYTELTRRGISYTS